MIEYYATVSTESGLARGRAARQWSLALPRVGEDILDGTRLHKVLRVIHCCDDMGQYVLVVVSMSYEAVYSG